MLNERTSDRLHDFEKKQLDLNELFKSVGSTGDESSDLFIQSFPRSKYINNDKIPPFNQLESSRIAFWNCRGVLSSLDFLSTFLYSNRIGILGLCETFLSDGNSSLVGVSGYRIVTRNRSTRSKGGLAVFIDQNLPIRKITDFNDLYQEMEFEFLMVEIKSGKEKLLLCLFYRPPGSSASNFIGKLNDLTQRMNFKNHKVVFMGDFNIDLGLVSSETQELRSLPVDLLTTCFSAGLVPTARIPTRISEQSASVIDNIFTNFNLHSSYVVLTDESDHSMLLGEFLINRLKSNPNIKVRRTIDDKSLQNLRAKLTCSDWTSVYEETNPDAMATLFIEKFSSALDSACPFSKKRSRYATPKKPWITQGLLTSIEHKNMLFRQYIDNPDVHGTDFKNYKNTLTTLLRKAKQAYYHKQFQEAEGSPKKTWTLINECLNKQKTNTFPETITKPDGTSSTSQQEVANTLNEFFACIGEATVEEAYGLSTVVTDNYKKYLPSPSCSSMFLSPVTEDELLKIVQAMKNGHSEGPDGSSNYLIKKTIDCYVGVIAHIVNSSFKDGIFPTVFKSAKVIPLHKGSDPKLPSNYRPISILSAFSKIMERCIYNRLMNYLTRSNFFNKYQFGFRPGHSTEHSIMVLLQFLNDAMDRDVIPATIFVDVKKAFDTICHLILLDKLDNCGIRGNALLLIQSYLSGRNQFVDGGAVRSVKTPCSEKVGVPQGSILGPLLFLIYANDLLDTITDDGLAVLFADDTANSVTGSDESSVRENLCFGLKKLLQWFADNLMVLNSSKTHFIIFSRISHAVPSISQISVRFNGELVTIARKESCKYLGLTVDENLSWKLHLDRLRMQLGRNVGLLRYLKFHLPFPALKSVYYSLIHSYFNYCPIAYLNTFKSLIKPLQRLQNNALRTLKALLPSPSSLPDKSPTKSLYTFLRILPVDLVLTANCVLFRLKQIKELLPLALNSSNFSLVSLVQNNYCLRRSSAKLPCPRIRTERSRFSPKNSIIKFWNIYESNIDSRFSIPVSKAKFKLYLISNYR